MQQEDAAAFRKQYVRALVRRGEAHAATGQLQAALTDFQEAAK
jgi:hypothetical protein